MSERACVFCAIVAGDAHAAIVLDEAEFVGFLDVRPVFKGHVLLVPRQHLVTLPDLPPRLRDPFVEAGQRLAAAMLAGLGAQGSFVAMNNTVSQSVPHLHLHVVPRTTYADGEAEEYAGRLRAALAAAPPDALADPEG